MWQVVPDYLQHSSQSDFAMLHKYQQLVPKPTNVAELRGLLEVIWDDLPYESIQKAVLAFRKRLQACCQSEGGHFEHLTSALALDRVTSVLQKTALFRTTK